MRVLVHVHLFTNSVAVFFFFFLSFCLVHLLSDFGWFSFGLNSAFMFSYEMSRHLPQWDAIITLNTSHLLRAHLIFPAHCNAFMSFTLVQHTFDFQCNSQNAYESSETMIAVIWSDVYIVHASLLSSHLFHNSFGVSGQCQRQSHHQYTDTPNVYVYVWIGCNHIHWVLRLSRWCLLTFFSVLYI